MFTDSFLLYAEVDQRCDIRKTISRRFGKERYGSGGTRVYLNDRGAMAGAFLAPFLYALYSKKVTAASCWACFILAPAFTLVGVFCRDAMPAFLKSPINTGALAMIGGLVIVPIVNLFSRKPQKELVDGAFACYEKTTVVQQATALGSETLR